jgi:hypothetical protein
MFRIAASILACSLVLATGCAKKPVAREAANVSTTAANVGNVRVDDELARLCNVVVLRLAARIGAPDERELPVFHDGNGRRAPSER